MKPHGVFLFVLLIICQLIGCSIATQTTIVCPPGIDCAHWQPDEDARTNVQPNGDVSFVFQKYGQVQSADEIASKIDEILETKGTFNATLYTPQTAQTLSGLHAQAGTDLWQFGDKTIRVSGGKFTNKRVEGCVKQIADYKHNTRIIFVPTQTVLFDLHFALYTNKAGQKCWAVYNSGVDNGGSGGVCHCDDKNNKPPQSQTKSEVARAVKNEVTNEMNYSGYSPPKLPASTWSSIGSLLGVMFGGFVLVFIMG